MTNVDLIEKKEIREQMISRVELLDKVKELFLIPEIETMTTKMVADYFEVDTNTVKQVYQRNKDEINVDGVNLVKNVEKFLKVQNVTPRITQLNGKKELEFITGLKIVIPNANVRLFSKRAVLRIAMLLRDSKIAQEVRTQLLNTFEHSTENQRITDIDEETKLWTEVGRASMSGDMQKINIAYANAFAFKNRHIAKLEEKNDELTESNKALAGEILSWSDRASLNKAVRIIASNRFVPFGVVWNELYNELLYKHNISLKARGKAPYINYIREDEWFCVNQSLCAICEDNGFSPSKIMKKAKLA